MGKAMIAVACFIIVLGIVGVLYFSNFNFLSFFAPDLAENKTYTTQSAVNSALSALNAIRESKGLLPLSSAPDASTIYRANDMSQNHYFGHYDLNGYAPSYYYTAMGGQYAMEENIACIYSSTKLGYNQLMNFVNDSIYSMVYNDSSSDWGHRDSLMDPTNNMVNISFAYDNNHAFLVIHMIKEWVQWDIPPSFAGGIFNCSGDFWPAPLPNGFESVNVYYSNPASNVNHTYDNDLRLTITGVTYNLGTVVAGVVPEPFHYEDIITIRPVTWDINSGVNKSHFSFSFQYQVNEGGLYTIMVFAKRPTTTLHPYDPVRYLDIVPVLEYTIKCACLCGG